MKKLRRSFPELLTLLCLLSWFFFCSVGHASEPEHYIITNQELTRLETNFSRLNTLNNLSQTRLATAEKNLTLWQDKYKKLNERFVQLEMNSKMQEQSLKNLRLSWKQSEEEARQRENKLRKQKTIAYAIALVSLLVPTVCQRG